MKLGFASDHAGFDLKERLKGWAIEQGHEVVDFGTDGSASVDYPDFAHRAAEGKDQWSAWCWSADPASASASRPTAMRHPLRDGDLP